MQKSLLFNSLDLMLIAIYWSEGSATLFPSRDTHKSEKYGWIRVLGLSCHDGRVCAHSMGEVNCTPFAVIVGTPVSTYGSVQDYGLVPKTGKVDHDFRPF